MGTGDRQDGDPLAESLHERGAVLGLEGPQDFKAGWRKIKESVEEAPERQNLWAASSPPPVPRLVSLFHL